MKKKPIVRSPKKVVTPKRTRQKGRVVTPLSLPKNKRGGKNSTPVKALRTTRSRKRN